MLKTASTPITNALWKQSQVERKNLSLKCASLTNRSYVFRKVQLFPNRYCNSLQQIGCKFISCQSWRSEKNFAARPTKHCMRAVRHLYPENGIILKICLFAMPIQYSEQIPILLIHLFRQEKSHLIIPIWEFTPQSLMDCNFEALDPHKLAVSFRKI